MRDKRTAKYIVNATFTIEEQNTYGDVLHNSVMTFTTECKTNGLAELGQMLSRVQYAMERPVEVMSDLDIQ